MTWNRLGENDLRLFGGCQQEDSEVWNCKSPNNIKPLSGCHNWTESTVQYNKWTESSKHYSRGYEETKPHYNRQRPAKLIHFSFHYRQMKNATVNFLFKKRWKGVLSTSVHVCVHVKDRVKVGNVSKTSWGFNAHHPKVKGVFVGKVILKADR